LGKLEEYRKEECFEKVEKILRNLSNFLRHDTVGGILEAPLTKLYRILTMPLDELKLWEEYGGYDPEKSMWGRFVCTANRYLGCMMKMGLSPPWLRKPEVMIEVHELYPSCVKYSEAAVGNVPSLRRGYGRRIEDVYVSPEDLALFECWIERKIGIKEIKRIYVDKDASDEVKLKVKEFAEKYNIPIVWKIPCPSDDEEVYPKWEKPSDYNVTDESLKELVDFLKRREEVCNPFFIRPIPDSVAAALAESLDMSYHGIYSIGASDAISVRNERLREARFLAHPPPEAACDRVVCEKILSKISSSMEKLK
jgi:vacuolar-type H+-ATPase subunit F/Vma7